jgi:protein-disulfide isomerase
MKKGHSENSQSGQEINPWMGVSMLLAVLLVISLGSNILLVSKLGQSGSDQPAESTVRIQPAAGAAPAPSVPSQAQPAQPQAAAVSADDDPVLGNKNAKVTLIEFSDFQCPFCKRLNDDAIQQIKKDYVESGKVKLVFRDYPLGFHPEAQKAAEAAECADDQGKFWEYHDLLFANQALLSITNYKAWAKQLGLNEAQFNTCLDSGKYASEVQKDFADGQAAGVSGTPTVFINGIRLVGAQPYSAFKQVIDAELAK